MRETIEAAISDAGRSAEGVLTAVTRVLTGLRPAIWVASVMTKDPRIVRAFAADDIDPVIERHATRLMSSPRAWAVPISTRVIETGEPLLITRIAANDFIEDYLDETTRRELKAIPAADLALELGVIVVPMRAGAATIGTLAMFDPTGLNPPDESDIAWLQSVADRAAVAVEAAQLHEDAATRFERLDAVQSIVLGLRSAQDVNLTLQIIAGRALGGLGVDASSVLVIDESTNTLAPAASAGFVVTAPGYRLALDDSLLNHAISIRGMDDLRACNALPHGRRWSTFAREGFQTYGAVALMSRGRWLGALEVFHRSRLVPDQECLSFLDTLAGMAAVAVDNAALQQRVEGTTRERRGQASRHGLTARELHILTLVVEGLTNREIAERINASESTVKSHVRRILDRTGAANRTDLTRQAIRQSWV